MREKTVTIAGMAADLRENRIADLREQREAFVESLKSEYDDLEAVPPEDKETFEEYNDEIDTVKQTAASLEHYAEECDGDGEFTLRELNMDQFAATVDEVDQLREQQRREEGNLPKGAMMSAALSRGVVACPDSFDDDPGAWPAVVARNVHDELDSLGAGAIEGNEPSIGDAWATT
jgi:hypothetical protein